MPKTKRIEILQGGLYKYDVHIDCSPGACDLCGQPCMALVAEFNSNEYGLVLCRRCITILFNEGFCDKSTGAFCLLPNGHPGEHAPRARFEPDPTTLAFSAEQLAQRAIIDTSAQGHPISGTTMPKEIFVLGVNRDQLDALIAALSDPWCPRLPRHSRCQPADEALLAKLEELRKAAP